MGRGVALLGGAMLLASLLALGTRAPLPATAGIFQGLGFDACSAPDVGTMSGWLASPYRFAGIYIGGANRTCGDGNLSRSWVSSVRGQGWSLEPLYVGLQSPCVDPALNVATMSTDPGTAAAQGAQAADDAVARAQNFGIGTGNPLYFDMEGYGAGCRSEVLAFENGWTSELHRQSYLSGVYGSSSSTISDLASEYPNGTPDDVAFANWNGSTSVFGDPYFPDSDWPSHQRLHQYQGGHNETYSGATLNIDSNSCDCSLVGGGPRLTVHYAYLDGPGHGVSAISVNDSNIWIERNLGNDTFGQPQLAANNGPFYGSVGTYVADLDGGARASAIAVNSSNIWIERNLGNDTFGSPQLAANNGPFYGSLGTFLADIDGSGRVSAIAVNSSSIWVERNLGNDTFGSPQLAASNGAFYGTVGTYLADIDGSGHASAIAVNSSNVWIERNLGNDTFGAPQLGANNGAFYGNVGTYMADVDGGRRASALAVNTTSIWMEHNLGNDTFGAPQAVAYGAPFYGSVGTDLADVDGSGRASALATNTAGIWLERNLGNDTFGSPQQAGPSIAFYGTR